MGQLDDDIDRWLEGYDESDDYEAPPLDHMRNNDEQTTIGAILEMTPGDRERPCWINGDFSGEASNIQVRQTKQGASFVTGTLTDPDTGAEIAFSAFGRKAFPSGLVTVGGQGISLGEYNGSPQLTIGQKATVVRAGGMAAPARGNAAPAPRQPPARQNAANAAARPAGGYVGEAVGHALNNACQMALKQWDADQIKTMGNEEYWRLVWTYASSILRMSDALRAGHLAPKPQPASEPDLEPVTDAGYHPDLEAQPPPRRENTRPVATSTGQAFEDSPQEDTSLPF